MTLPLRLRDPLPRALWSVDCRPVEGASHGEEQRLHLSHQAPYARLEDREIAEKRVSA